VHGAKGLEFDVVAVADLGRNLQLGWSPLRVRPGEEGPEGNELARVGVQLGRLGRPAERLHDYYELTELAAERDAEEEARLAYVAATRAKRRLLLSGTFNPNSVGDEPSRRKPIALQLIRSLLGGDVAEQDAEIPPAGDGFPSGRIRVSVSRPEPGAGATLLVPRPADTVAPPDQEGEPPLRRPEVPPALVGGLSYSALSDFENCGYRFYVQRVLGIAEPEAAAGTSGDPDSPSGDVRRRFGPGVAVHALLEWSARNRWREPGGDRIAAALREQGLESDAEQTEAAERLVRAFLGSPLREEIGDAKVSAEVPFVLSVAGTRIRGSIDLLVERPDGSVLVVDYKTNKLERRTPREVAERYRVQRDLYALAAAARGGPVETAYVFLEQPDAPVLASFERPELDDARAAVETLLARLAEGRFEVTQRPHRDLCLDCPARDRLCSHDAAAQLRDDPDPPIAPSGDDRQMDAGSGEPQLSLLEGS
jgi:ATP-dependent helicase/nuclease subunit A